jgi:hypothetical protein
MNSQANTRRWSWQFFWQVVLAAVAGVVIFAFLSFASAGVLASAVTATVLPLIALGFLQYFLWGRALLASVAPERRQAEVQVRRERTSATPVDEFPLLLNDRERIELLNVLEETLARTSAPSSAAVTGNSRFREEVLRELRDRLRGYGS